MRSGWQQVLARFLNHHFQTDRVVALFLEDGTFSLAEQQEIFSGGNETERIHRFYTCLLRKDESILDSFVEYLFEVGNNELSERFASAVADERLRWQLFDHSRHRSGSGSSNSSQSTRPASVFVTSPSETRLGKSNSIAITRNRTHSMNQLPEETSSFSWPSPLRASDHGITNPIEESKSDGHFHTLAGIDDFRTDVSSTEQTLSMSPEQIRAESLTSSNSPPTWLLQWTTEFEAKVSTRFDELSKRIDAIGPIVVRTNDKCTWTSEDSIDCAHLAHHAKISTNVLDNCAISKLISKGK